MIAVHDNHCHYYCHCVTCIYNVIAWMQSVNLISK